jgi:hypothetical protein
MKIRIDFFKPSGKWAYDEYIQWVTLTRPALPRDEFERSLQIAFPNNQYNGLIVVLIEPDATDLNSPGFPMIGYWKDGKLLPIHTVKAECFTDHLE